MVKTKKELQAMLAEILLNKGVSITQIKHLMGYALNKIEEEERYMRYIPLNVIMGSRSSEVAKLKIEDFELKVKQEK